MTAQETKEQVGSMLKNKILELTDDYEYTFSFFENAVTEIIQLYGNSQWNAAIDAAAENAEAIYQRDAILKLKR